MEFLQKCQLSNMEEECYDLNTENMHFLRWPLTSLNFRVTASSCVPKVKLKNVERICL